MGHTHLLCGIEFVLGEIPGIFVVAAANIWVSSVLQQKFQDAPGVMKDGNAHTRPALEVSGIRVGLETLGFYTHFPFHQVPAVFVTFCELARSKGTCTMADN